MYFILFYRTINNYVKKRQPYREEHLARAKAAYERGEILLAGALAEPTDTAVLVFKGDSSEAAIEFAKNDPYVKNGLVHEWEVRPWNVVVGG